VIPKAGRSIPQSDRYQRNCNWNGDGDASNRLKKRRGRRLGQHRRLFRHAELRQIRSGREIDPNLVLVPFVIVLSDALPNFHRSGTNHRIEIGIVIRGTSEDFDA